MSVYLHLPFIWIFMKYRNSLLEMFYMRNLCTAKITIDLNYDATVHIVITKFYEILLAKYRCYKIN